mmetsp:Transcript_7544/g.11194  ORF Transcript_7544/g.11194 Transcript_7544/m.11194 type:complete len:798 (-) Transcript_7544:14-2407(-)
MFVDRVKLKIKKTKSPEIKRYEKKKAKPKLKPIDKSRYHGKKTEPYEYYEPPTFNTNSGGHWSEYNSLLDPNMVNYFGRPDIEFLLSFEDEQKRIKYKKNRKQRYQKRHEYKNLKKERRVKKVIDFIEKENDKVRPPPTYYAHMHRDEIRAAKIERRRKRMMRKQYKKLTEYELSYILAFVPLRKALLIAQCVFEISDTLTFYQLMIHTHISPFIHHQIMTLSPSASPSSREYNKLQQLEDIKFKFKQLFKKKYHQQHVYAAVRARPEILDEPNYSLLTFNYNKKTIALKQPQDILSEQDSLLYTHRTDDEFAADESIQFHTPTNKSPLPPQHLQLTPPQRNYHTRSPIEIPYDSPRYAEPSLSSIIYGPYSDIFWSHSLSMENNVMSTMQDVCQPIVSQLMDACMIHDNGCVFAYGGNKSGKTHNLYGSSSKNGIIKRFGEAVFRHYSPNEVTMHVSQIQIIDNMVTDLLNPGQIVHIEHDLIHGPHLENLVILQLKSYQEFSKVVDLARQENYSHHNSKMVKNRYENTQYRHTVFFVSIISNENNFPISTIAFVDLADCMTEEYQLDFQNLQYVLIERRKRAKAKQGTKGEELPFRLSLLTYILQHCLENTSRVMMLGCVNTYNYEQCNNVLEYVSVVKGQYTSQTTCPNSPNMPTSRASSSSTFRHTKKKKKKKKETKKKKEIKKKKPRRRASDLPGLKTRSKTRGSFRRASHTGYVNKNHHHLASHSKRRPSSQAKVIEIQDRNTAIIQNKVNIQRELNPLHPSYYENLNKYVAATTSLLPPIKNQSFKNHQQ